MGHQNTINTLLDEVEDIKELLLHIREKDHISEIEIDLAKDKLRQVYDIFRMFERSSSNPKGNVSEQTSKTESAQVKEEKPVSKPEEKHITEDRKPPQTDDFEVKSVTEPQSPLTEEEMTMTLGDKYKSLSDSLNDHMGRSQKKNDLASRYQSKPIKDIHAAIGINEKFQFIKELFKGNADLYNETIQKLNNASNFNEAYMYLNENFDWDMEDESVKRILELTRRKFISQGDE
jgi:hypothetical protein